MKLLEVKFIVVAILTALAAAVFIVLMMTDAAGSELLDVTLYSGGVEVGHWECTRAHRRGYANSSNVLEITTVDGDRMVVTGTVIVRRR